MKLSDEAVRLTLTKKISLLLLISLFGSLASIAFFATFLEETKADGHFMNVAGRQRMLSAELRTWAHMVAIGQEEDRAGLQARIAEFDKSLSVMERGGEVLDGLLVPAPPEVRGELAAVDNFWRGLKPDLTDVAVRPRAEPQFQEAYRRVESGTDELKELSHQLVTRFDERTRRLGRQMLYTLASVACLTGIIFLAGVFLVRRYIVQPILRIDEAARRIGAGDFTQRLEIATRDELSVVAHTFNQMVAQTERLLSALNLQHRHAETIIESVPAGLLVLRDDLAVLRANRSFRETFGVDEQAIARHPMVAELLPVSGLKEAVLEVLSTGEAKRNLLMEMPAKDGSSRLLRITLAGTRLAKEEEARLLVVIEDVSEEHRLREQARAHEAHYQDLVQGLDAVVWEAEVRGQEIRFTLISDHAEALLGYPVQHWLGHEFWPAVVHPDDRDAVFDFYNRVLESGPGAGEERGRYEIEYRANKADGGLIWLQDVAHLVRGADGAGRLRGVTVDITERKQAEQALRQSMLVLENTFEFMDQGISVADADLQLVGMNRRFRELLDLPESLCKPNTPFAAFIRYNAERGDYGPGDVEEQVRTRTELARRFEPHRFERERPDGTILEVRGTPISSGGFVTTYTDITQRARSERALRDSEARFRNLTELSTDWYWEQDENLRFVEPSIRSLERLNMIPGEALGKTRWELHSANVTETQWIAHRADLDARRPFRDFEFARVDHDGNTVYVSISGMPIFDGEGAFRGYRGVGTDITERKTTENVLRLLSTGMAQLSGEAFFNEVASRTAEYLKAEVGFVNRLQAPANTRIRTLGLCVGGQVIPPVEYDLADTPCEAVIGKQPVILPEQMRQRFPGFRMAADLGASGYAAVPLFDTLGAPIGAVGVMSRAPLRQPAAQVEALLRLFAVRTAAEIERLGAEARFRDLFEFSADACVIVNRAGVITAINEDARLLFGYSREELVGLPVEILVPETLRGGHAGMCRNFFAASSSGPMGAGRTDLYARRKDGTTFPADIDVHPLQTDDGVVMVATVHDLSAQRQDEERRRALESQLRQSQKMEAVGTLAGGIAHDFNNIIGAILGNAELARVDVGAGHPALESIAEINKAGRRARDLVQQILAFSRKQTLSRSVIALGPVVEEAVKLLQATLPAGVRLTVDCAANLPNVSADPTQIHQVLVNLCTNAWHAMEGRPGNIDIRLEEVSVDAALAREHAGLRPGKCMRLSVRDTGKGMDAAMLERIFEPFFTTKAIDEGTGLGLSVVHGIMQGHEGAIVVDSTPGKGTMFQLYFPAVDAPAAAHNAAAAVPVLPQGREQHVLYLDDDEALVSLVSRMLERQGYRVSGYTLAQQALDAVRADPGGFDLVVSDFNMPGMSGLDVARELSRIRPDLPVAVTSGYITDELREKAPASGVRHLIYKPDTADELCEVVRRLTKQAD